MTISKIVYAYFFYILIVSLTKVRQLVAQLPWGHNLLLIEKTKDKDVIFIHAENAIKNV